MRLKGIITMKKGNDMEGNRDDDNDIKGRKIGKISITDMLIMIGGVVTIGIATILLSWIIM